MTTPSPDEINAQIAEFDRQLARPWLKDLRAETLVASAQAALNTYAEIRAVDNSGVIGELLDLLEAVTARLAAHPAPVVTEEMVTRADIAHIGAKFRGETPYECMRAALRAALTPEPIPQRSETDV